MTVDEERRKSMPRTVLLASLLALAPLAAVMAAGRDTGGPECGGVSSATMLPDSGRLGPVRRYDAQGTPKDVMLLVSDVDGWDSRARGCR